MRRKYFDIFAKRPEKQNEKSNLMRFLMSTDKGWKFVESLRGQFHSHLEWEDHDKFNLISTV